MKTQAGFLMSQIKQVGARLFDQMIRDSGISEFTGAQGRILYVLWENGPVPISEISRMTGLAKTTLTGMLDRMEASGLVTRTHDSRNRRQIIISLTEKSAELGGDYNALSGQINDVYFRGFSPQEIEAFEGYLRRILDNLSRGS